MRLRRIAPVFLVRDVRASVAFWRDRVGFETAEIHGEPPSFAMPTRDDVTVMLVQVPEGVGVPPPNWRVVDKVNQAYVWVDDVDTVFEACLTHGIDVIRPPQDEPWGVRELHLCHPDGHVFRVSRGTGHDHEHDHEHDHDHEHGHPHAHG